jgi:hypothetical protein
LVAITSSHQNASDAEHQAFGIPRSHAQFEAGAQATQIFPAPRKSADMIATQQHSTPQQRAFGLLLRRCVEFIFEGVRWR